MKPGVGARYEDVGVLTNQDLGLEALLKSVRLSEAFRRGKATGESALAIGYFANVVKFGPNLGLALTTDGVGTKVLVAEMVDRYDTLGIDCVAMNVNDVICVGAEPVSMLDYIAVEKADARVLEEIGRGLLEGARQAGINIVGGEISQMKEVIKGQSEGSGIDLVGMCVGVVKLDEVNVGQAVEPGDVIIGLRSSGVHSNGLTLARRVLFASGAHGVEARVAELGHSLAEELLTPTRIYVKEVLDLLAQKLPIRAMVHITSDGFLNLCRIQPAVGFNLTHLPEPQPIFDLIQRAGSVEDAEMHRVYNMGIGFCVIVPPDGAVVAAVERTVKAHGGESVIIGEVVKDERRSVLIPQKRLVGRGDHFVATGA